MLKSKSGKLFYVIGASGAGKDTLLTYVRENIGDDIPLVFAHRYITRPVNAGTENHIALSQREFIKRKSLGFFALDWFSHDTYYGIGVEINHWLALGVNVVMNGSREYLPTAKSIYPALEVVLVVVSNEALRQRLNERGRENGAAIEERITRNNSFQNIDTKDFIVINNDFSIELAGQRLLEVLSNKSTSKNNNNL